MKAYRMKHIPTGLYLRPSAEVKIKLKSGAEGYVKTNLSKVGKLYARKPTLAWLNGEYYDHVAIKELYDAMGFDTVYRPDRNRPFAVSPEDWQIEEVTA